MAIKSKFPLEYAVNITEKANEDIRNYDILTISLDRKTYSQEEMAGLISSSIDKVLMAKDEAYISLSKEEIHNIDINKHKLIVKLPVSYKKRNENKFNLNGLQSQNKSKDNNKLHLNEDDFDDNHYESFTSSFYSGISGYGLNLI